MGFVAIEVASFWKAEGSNLTAVFAERLAIESPFTKLVSAFLF